jgi:DNA repair and recombination protein RAD52
VFTEQQKALLEKPLLATNVRTRSQAGRNLSYIEGWFVIAEANRIFGFDGWSSETISTTCIVEKERKIGKAPNQRDGWAVSYNAKVRVIVFAGDTIVTREGIGTGHGIDADLGLAHESAIKEAETDSRKRALMTFGNQMGLALYDRAQTNVSHDDPEPPRDEARDLFLTSIRKRISEFVDVTALGMWWSSDAEKQARRDFELTPDEVEGLKALVIAKREELTKRKAA